MKSFPRRRSSDRKLRMPALETPSVNLKYHVGDHTFCLVKTRIVSIRCCRSSAIQFPVCVVAMETIAYSSALRRIRRRCGIKWISNKVLSLSRFSFARKVYGQSRYFVEITLVKRMCLLYRIVMIIVQLL